MTPVPAAELTFMVGQLFIKGNAVMTHQDTESQDVSITVHSVHKCFGVFFFLPVPYMSELVADMVDKHTGQVLNQ